MKRAIIHKPLPVLKQFATLWTLTEYPSKSKEWSWDEKFKQIKKAGFDAVGGAASAATVPLCQKYGLDFIGGMDANAHNFKERLEQVKMGNPTRINVQFCDHDTPPREATRAWAQLKKLADKMGLQVDLEMHRDTCTETPEKTYEIASLYEKAVGEKIRFSWDFSHPAVIKHVNPPYAGRLLVKPDLIQLSRHLHFRPFNGHHAQIPATDGKGNETPEFKFYVEFIDALLACWLKGAKGGEVLYVCPEFGPLWGGYGLSCFPDVWKETIYLRKRIEEIWAKNLRQWGK